MSGTSIGQSESFYFTELSYNIHVCIYRLESPPEVMHKGRISRGISAGGKSLAKRAHPLHYCGGDLFSQTHFLVAYIKVVYYQPLFSNGLSATVCRNMKACQTFNIGISRFSSYISVDSLPLF